MSSAPLEPRWPPRSPHEALLSSPSGRNKIRQYHDRTSPSPSPLKRSATTPNLNTIRQRWRRRASVEEELKEEKAEEAEEEDEETLQLQLQALEAKLRLKKLQQKRKAATVEDSSDAEKDGRQDGRSAAKENRPPSVQAPAQASRGVGPKRQATRDVQIAASPQKSMRAQENAQSPKKVLLGIDKGLKGRNISLKRAPSEKAQDDDPFVIPPSSSHRSTYRSLPRSSSVHNLTESDRLKSSFSERIAQSRQEDTRRNEHANRVRKQQSTGFGMAQEELANAKRMAMETESAKIESKALVGPVEFSRDEILKAASQKDSVIVRRSNTKSSISRSRRAGSPTKSTDIWLNPNAEPEIPKPLRTSSTSNTSKQRARSNSPRQRSSEEPPYSPLPQLISDPLFESFSSLHLAKRLLPHDFLTKTFSEKSVFRLPDLLGSVKSPDYSLPDDLEGDYVILSIIASKSSPLTHKNRATNNKQIKHSNLSSVEEAADSEQNTNGKYMVLTLTDLKWSVDLYLFSTGYTKFWKLVPGTVIALLNPSIMPPPPGKSDTGRFSLTLNSSDDTVLEIGRARDLGWCSSVRKDGKVCGSWVDQRHTSVCEFHVDRVVERTRSSRMEVAGMSAPFAPGGRKGGRTGYFGGRKEAAESAKKGDGFTREGAHYDRSSRSTYFMAPSLVGRRSAAQLLDAEGFQIDRAGGSKEERMRKRLAEREREDEIARKLGQGGNGAGSEYLRLKHGDTDARIGRHFGDAGGEEEPVDAKSLGLKRNLAREVQLSPIKKRKMGLQTQMGLGGESARKKTRFVTAGGIKEAGRDSLGVVAPLGQEGDDDDELDVV